jgi:hypothetical protein
VKLNLLEIMKLKLSTLLSQLTKCLAIALVFLPGVVASAPVYTVTPPVIELDLEPRDSREETIKVTNTGTEPIKLFPSVHPIVLGPDGSIAEFVSAVMTDRTTAVTSWIEMSRARVELQPGETVKIPVRVTVNPQAKPGEYYAYLGFGAGDKRDEAEAAVMKQLAPGVTLRVALLDIKSEYLRLHQFTTERYTRDSDAIELKYELENVGDSVVIPRGEIILYDVRGREIGSVPVNAEAASISPNERKQFTAVASTTGVYGRHKAFLNIEYGQEQRANLYDTTFFTVIPLEIIIASFVGLLLVTLTLTLLYIYRRRPAVAYETEDGGVPMSIRSGVFSDQHEHDINLKQN